MDPASYRYTDEDVRDNQANINLATDYALQYRGDFQPMVQARLVAEHDGVLPAPTARMVLNCMRSDIRVNRDLPPPERTLATRLCLVTDNSVRLEQAAIKHEVKLVQPAKYRWPGPLYYSTHKAAYYVHYLDVHHSYLRFYRNPSTNQQTAKLVTRALCGPHFTSYGKISATMPEGMEHCRRCLSQVGMVRAYWEEQGWPTL